MSRRKVAELDTPFSSVEWPAISQQDQDTILELLCTLLSPLGQHRRDHVVPSRGKRGRRQPHQSKEAQDVAAATDGSTGVAPTGQNSHSAKSSDVPPPELARFVDVGLASITRELAKGGVSASTGPDTPPPSSSPFPYTAVFVARSAHPSAFYSQFPQMVAVASQAAGSSTSLSTASSPNAASPIRLVGFSRTCEERLSSSLGIPRVSSVALRVGAPQSQGLVAFLHDKVPPVNVGWLDEAQAGRYRETQIHMADVRVGPKKKKKV